MASSPHLAACLLLLLLGVDIWVDADCQDGDTTVYVSKTLETGDVLWWCKDKAKYLPGGNRTHISTCDNPAHIDSAQDCSNDNIQEGWNTCSTEDVEEPPNTQLAEKFPKFYGRYYTCEEGMTWLSGARGRLSQCTNGNWSYIQDVCVKDICLESHKIRDCSLIVHLGFTDEEATYMVVPSGEKGGQSIGVDCFFEKEHLVGWTRISRSGKDASIGDVGPDGGGNLHKTDHQYFIGIENLVAMNYGSDSIRLLSFKFFEGSKMVGVYGDIAIKKDDPYTLNDGSNWGKGVGFMIQKGKDFSDDRPWWELNENNEGLFIDDKETWFDIGYGYGKKDISLLDIWVRPHEELDTSCKHNYLPEHTENMAKTWNGKFSYRSIAKYTCDSGYYMNENQSSTYELECLGSLRGWVPKTLPIFHSCRRYCKDEPPTPGANMDKADVKGRLSGSLVKYSCPSEGHLIPASYPNITNYTYIRCDETGTWVADPFDESELLCAEMCLDEPFTGQANNTWDHVARVVGTQINLTCPDGYAFPDYNTTIVITCESGGHWTEIDSNDTACKKICFDEPLTYGLDNTWDKKTRDVGTQFNLTCPEGYAFPDYNTTIEVTCESEGSWTRVSPNNTNCSRICFDDPFSGYANNTWDQKRDIGTKFNLSCPEGLVFPDLNTTIEVTCESEGTWTEVSPNDTVCRMMCLDQPFMPTSPVNISWDLETRLIGTKFNLTCPEGFAFPNYNTTIEVTCEAGGNWTEISPNDTVCRMITWELPTAPNSTEYFGPIPIPPFWEGTKLNYTCPENTLSSTGNNSTHLTFNGTDWVSQDPEFVCIEACMDDPFEPSSPGNTTWNQETRYVGTKFNLTCPEGFAFPNYNTTIDVTCEAGGDWTEINPNDTVCRMITWELPTTPNSTEYFGPAPIPPFWEGTKLNYTCPENTLSSTVNNSTHLTFNGTDWVSQDPEFVCIEACMEDPFQPSFPGNTTWNQETRYVGTKFNLTCPEGFAFPNYNTTIDVTCEAGGDWTEINPNDTVCRMITWELPTTPNSTEYFGPAPIPPFWEGTKLNYTCPENTLSSTVNNSTHLTFNGTDWVSQDPEFVCIEACMEDPFQPSFPGNTTWNQETRYVGTKFNLTCPEGFAFPNYNTTIEVTCEAGGNWTEINPNDTVCRMTCMEDPFQPSFPGNTTWNQKTRYVATKFNLTCPAGYAFPDHNTTKEMTCEPGGKWTEIHPNDTLCRMITWDLPTAPRGSEYSGPAAIPPFWEGTKLNYTCPEKTLSSTGNTSTHLTFNGTDWVSLDPEFFCLNVCGDPSPAEDPVSLNFSGRGVEGDEAVYLCPGGFEGSDNTSLVSTCMDRNWTLEDLPVCKMCKGRPKLKRGDARKVKVEEFGLPVYGAVISYTCERDFFKDHSVTINVTCVNGTWSRKEIPKCKRYAFKV